MTSIAVVQPNETIAPVASAPRDGGGDPFSALLDTLSQPTAAGSSAIAQAIGIGMPIEGEPDSAQPNAGAARPEGTLLPGEHPALLSAQPNAGAAWPDGTLLPGEHPVLLSALESEAGVDPSINQQDQLATETESKFAGQSAFKPDLYDPDPAATETDVDEVPADAVKEEGRTPDASESGLSTAAANADQGRSAAAASSNAPAAPEGPVATASMQNATKAASGMSSATQPGHPEVPAPLSAGNSRGAPAHLEAAHGHGTALNNPAAADGTKANASASSGDSHLSGQGDGKSQPFHAPPKEAMTHARSAPSQEAQLEASLARQTGNPAAATSVSSMQEPVRALAATLNPAGQGAANLAEPNPVPLTGTALAIEIMSRMREGIRRFEIRLDPPELGRVDVRLEVDRQGQATTRLTVDRPETLELLLREARGLERALQQAGLKTDAGGLEFSLRSQGHDDASDGRSGRAGSPRPDLLVVDDIEPVISGFDRYRLAAQLRGGVDIRV